MTQLRSIDISELDFDQIKANLKEFLRDQSEFTDYDFEGSALSVLLDVLAYNTHYNAYLANMLANEMFLDSAVKRSSAVSIAKHLGYTPLSTRSARALVSVEVVGASGSPTTLTLPSKTAFNTTVSGNTFTFYNISTATAPSVDGIYSFNDIEVVEGTIGAFTYAVVAPGPEEKYEIPDADIDTSTLRVLVQTSQSNTVTDTYALSSDISNVTSSSKVYFLDENPTGRFEIYFGDGVIGKKLTAGNLVKIDYLRSSGVDANSSNTVPITFTTGSISGSANVTVTTSRNPTGAKEKDTITDIKFKAPKINAARNRAVTASDYEAIILANFSDAESVSVWGGEENDPPYYGKVLISLKPFDGFTIPQTTKDIIRNQILQSKRVLAIQPEFIDPEFFYVNLTVNITFDSTATTKTSGELETIIRSTVDNYFSSDLQKFNRDFNKAKLSRLILESDTSISTVILLIKLQKRNVITLNSENSFIAEKRIKFENSIVPGSVISSRVFVNYNNTATLARVVDIPSTMPPNPLGSGTLRLINQSSNITIQPNIGAVNYGTGEVTIFSLTPTALPNSINDFRVTATVQETSHNLQVNRNQILVLDDSTRNALSGTEAGLSVNITPVVE